MRNAQQSDQALKQRLVASRKPSGGAIPKSIRGDVKRAIATKQLTKKAVCAYFHIDYKELKEQLK